MHRRNLSTNPKKEIGQLRTIKANNILADAATLVWRLQLDSTMDANEKKIIIEAVAFQVDCGRTGKLTKYSVSYIELADCNNLILLDFYSCFDIYFTILNCATWDEKKMGHTNNTVAVKYTWQANNFGHPYTGRDLTSALLSDTVLKGSFLPLRISVRDHHEILFSFWWKYDRDSPEVASWYSDHQIFIKGKERMFWPLLAGGRMIWGKINI